MQVDFCQLLVLSSFQDGTVQHSIDHFRKYRKDIYTHGSILILTGANILKKSEMAGRYVKIL